MKKIFTVLALLLVFSLLYSCNGKDTDTDDSVQSDNQSEEQTTEDTQNRISQSTLPPLDSEEDDETEPSTGGNGNYSSGDSKYFKHETGSGNYGNSLTVTEDSGFGGEIERTH